MLKSLKFPKFEIPHGKPKKQSGIRVAIILY